MSEASEENAKKPGKPRFIFTPEDDEAHSIKISVATEPDDKYGRELCELRFSESAKRGGKNPYWIGQTFPYEMQYAERIKEVRFPAKTDAAWFMFLLRENWKATVEAQPLPPDIMNYMNRQAEDFRKEEEHVMSMFLDLRIRRWQLAQFAKKYNIEPAQYRSADTDQEKAIKELLEFQVYVKQEKGEVPLFSEAALYNLIGKDDARTVLSMMRKVTMFISPQLADLL